MCEETQKYTGHWAHVHKLAQAGAYPWYWLRAMDSCIPSVFLLHKIVDTPPATNSMADRARPSAAFPLSWRFWWQQYPWSGVFHPAACCPVQVMILSPYNFHSTWGDSRVPPMGGWPGEISRGSMLWTGLPATFSHFSGAQRGGTTCRLLCTHPTHSSNSALGRN